MAKEPPKLPYKSEHFEFPNTGIMRLVRGENGSQFDRIRTVFEVRLEQRETQDALQRYKISGVASDVDLVISLLKDVTHQATLLYHKKNYNDKYDPTPKDYQEIKAQFDISVPILSAHRGAEARDLLAVERAIMQMRQAIGPVPTRTNSNGEGLQNNFADAAVGEGKKAGKKAKTGKAGYEPVSEAQAIGYVALLDPQIDVVFLAGDGGTGKTRLALHAGLEAIDLKLFKALEIYKPDQGAGDHPGSFPGTLEEKSEPFLENISDELRVLTGRDLEENKKSGLVKKSGTPFSVRGKTYLDTFVIIDEAQNLTMAQAKMLSTRLGTGSKVVILGDDSDEQHDRKGECPGLSYLIAVHGAGFNHDHMKSRSNMAFVKFTADDSHARHPLLPTIHSNHQNLSPELRQAMLDMENIPASVRRGTEVFMSAARREIDTAAQITRQRFEMQAKALFPAVFGLTEPQKVVSFQQQSGPGRNP